MCWRCREREKKTVMKVTMMFLCSVTVLLTKQPTTLSLSLTSLQNVRFKGDPKIRGGSFVVFTMHWGLTGTMILAWGLFWLVDMAENGGHFLFVFWSYGNAHPLLGDSWWTVWVDLVILKNIHRLGPLSSWPSVRTTGWRYTENHTSNSLIS